MERTVEDASPYKILRTWCVCPFQRVILSGVKRSRTFGRTCSSKSKSRRLAGISDGVLPNHFLGKNIFFAQKGITNRHRRSHRRCRSSVLLACFASPRKTSTPHRRWRRSAQDDTVERNLCEHGAGRRGRRPLRFVKHHAFAHCANKTASYFYVCRDRAAIFASQIDSPCRFHRRPFRAIADRPYGGCGLPRGLIIPLSSP